MIRKEMSLASLFAVLLVSGPVSNTIAQPPPAYVIVEVNDPIYGLIQVGGYMGELNYVGETGVSYLRLKGDLDKVFSNGFEEIPPYLGKGDAN